MMKAGSAREYSDPELKQLLQDKRKELVSLKAGSGAGEAEEQPLKARELRREIARILTVIREREIGKPVGS